MRRTRSKPQRTPVTSGACWVTKGDGTSLAVVVTLIFTPLFYRTGGVLSAVLCGCGASRVRLIRGHPWLKILCEPARCHQCGRSHRGADRRTHAAHRSLPPARRAGAHHTRIPRRHLHRAVELSHRQNTGAARHRRQRLVPPRAGRSPVLETVKPFGAKPETVGRAPPAV